MLSERESVSIFWDCPESEGSGYASKWGLFLEDENA